MSKLETGKNAASLVTLHKVAPILGTTIDELLNDETTAAKPPKKTKGKQV
jgi:transcriptional regulator with XRE-family HTH domain